MTGVFSETSAINVDTLQLTRALKHLLKIEPGSDLVRLMHDADSGTLTILMGETSRDVPSTGTFVLQVSIGRAWAEALAANPVEAAITDLRQVGEKLFTRDFVVQILQIRAEESDSSLEREGDIDEAHRKLMHYKVTKPDVRALVETANLEIARLWGPNDDPLIDEIASAWKGLAPRGVEPSDIRRLIDRKSRELWKSGPKRVAGGYSLFARYNVTEAEKRALEESGDPVKAALWARDDGRPIEDVAHAWKHLASHGVEPSEIRRLIDRKSR